MAGHVERVGAPGCGFGWSVGHGVRWWGPGHAGMHIDWASGTCQAARGDGAYSGPVHWRGTLGGSGHLVGAVGQGGTIR